jgi:hypothetical protein
MATRTASRRSSAGDKLRSRTRPRILSRASMNSLSSLACSGQLMVRVESKHIGHLLKTARSNVTPRRTKSKHYFSLSVRLKALCAVRPLERRPSFPSLSLNFLTCASEKCTFQKLYQGRSIMQTQGQPHRGSKTPKKHHTWRHQQARMDPRETFDCRSQVGRTKRGNGMPIKAVETEPDTREGLRHPRYAPTPPDRSCAMFRHREAERSHCAHNGAGTDKPAC